MVKLVVMQGDREDSDSSAYTFVLGVNSAAGSDISRIIRYSDLIFVFQDSMCSVKIVGSNQKFENLADEFYLRDYHGYQHERYALANYLSSKSKKVYNSDLLRNEALSKLEQLVVLAINIIPTAKSIYVSDSSKLDSKLDYPVVVKSISASNNRLNYLVHSVKDLGNAIKKIGKKVLVQEYIDNDGDYKVMIMYGQAVMVYKRVVPNSYRKYDRADRIAVKDQDVARLAEAAAKTLGREFCGVDIVRDKHSGKLYVLECNFNAGLYMSGIGVDENFILKAAKMIQSKR